MVFAYGPDMGPVDPKGEQAALTRPSATATATNMKGRTIFRIEYL